jgi:hypothetical protein
MENGYPESRNRDEMINYKFQISKQNKVAQFLAVHATVEPAHKDVLWPR